MNTLDWDKLEKFIAEREPVEVSAGLLEDWYWTAATVYENEKWQDRERAFVTSQWATPGFKAVMKNGDTIEVVASRTLTEEGCESEISKREANLSQRSK